MPEARKTITALRERPRGHVEVELDGRPWRLLPAEAVVRSGLAVGRAFDRETARELGRALRRASALARATRALAAHDRTRSSLEERLARAGVPQAARHEALGTLERVGLLDDARFAADRARRLADRGYGDGAIRFDLERQGVTDELAAEAVGALEPERERAARLVELRGRDGRTARWLAGRGFDAASVEDALGGFAGEG